MEIKEMTIEELEARKAQIAEEVEVDDADLDALEEEVRAIKAELETRKAEEAKKAEIRSAVASGAGTVVKEFEEEKKTVMNNEEIRNSKEYIDAYAEYIKSSDPTECRALLSENDTNGTVPVPELVYDIVKTAWEREGIMSRVRKAYLRGNLKVGFEISSSAAATHSEGVAVNEESLVLGVVELIPESIKKWISISDEALDMRGESFLRYIYDELAYRIAKKAADLLVAKIQACGTVSTTTCPGVPAIKVATPTLGTVADAIAQLSDEAANPVIMMNKLTWATFKGLQAAGNYGYDPFEGLPVVFNDTITAISAATTGVAYMIVGDLDHGALANFPNGDDITFKYDEMTLATQDLVRVIGREFVGMGVVAPNAFVKVTK
jgi:HK97 family phage major capsid protein